MSTAIAVPEDVKEKGINLEWEIEALQITAETLEQGQGLLKSIADFRKELVAITKPSVDAAFKAHKTVKALEKTLLQPTVDAEELIRKKLREYAMMVDRAAAKREAELRAKQLEEQKKNPTAPPAPIVKVETAVSTKGSGFRDGWEYEVIDEDLIPDEYRMIDYPTIGKVVRAKKDKTNIPGIKVIKTKIPVSG